MSASEDLTCREVVELLTAYLEGALSPSDAARVESHVAGCDGCTMVLDEFRDTIRLTGMVSEDSLTTVQRETLRNAFRDWAAERT